MFLILSLAVWFVWNYIVVSVFTVWHGTNSRGPCRVTMHRAKGLCAAWTILQKIKGCAQNTHSLFITDFCFYDNLFILSLWIFYGGEIAYHYQYGRGKHNYAFYKTVKKDPSGSSDNNGGYRENYQRWFFHKPFSLFLRFVFSVNFGAQWKYNLKTKIMDIKCGTMVNIPPVK